MTESESRPPNQKRRPAADPEPGEVVSAVLLSAERLRQVLSATGGRGPVAR